MRKAAAALDTENEGGDAVGGAAQRQAAAAVVVLSHIVQGAGAAASRQMRKEEGLWLTSFGKELDSSMTVCATTADLEEVVESLLEEWPTRAFGSYLQILEVEILMGRLLACSTTMCYCSRCGKCTACPLLEQVL